MTTLADLIADAGLTGRGGGEFPTAVKIAAAQRNNAELIVNACDGEHGAAKDGWVIARHLDEVVTAARRIVGDRFRIAAHRDSATLQTLQQAGMPSLSVPHRYVSSEESALANLANGGLARPLSRTSPLVSGVLAPDGRAIPPTLVLNAETLWRIEQIVQRGPRWFRSTGTADEPGPRLATISGVVARPGVYETYAGTSVGGLIDLAGGLVARSEVLWLNGIGGGFLPLSGAAGVAWSRAGLGEHGLRIGPAIVHVVDARVDPWPFITQVVEYAAAESAGQCGPCMFGLPAVADDLAMVASGEASHEDWRRFRRRLALLPGRGSCRHPDGVANFLASALRMYGHRLPALRDHRPGVRHVAS
ncbi:NADH-ubiquinone oxidoreductase-F iron-sulfur binding region domain-containing protein [Gordonia sp. NPDC003424]